MQRGTIASSLLLVCCSHRCFEVDCREISGVKARWPEGCVSGDIFTIADSVVVMMMMMHFLYITNNLYLTVELLTFLTFNREDRL